MLAVHPWAASLYFDRASDWVTMGDTFRKEWNEAFSLSAWVYWDGDLSAGRCIISKDTNGEDAGYNLQIKYGSIPRLQFILANIYATNAIEVFGPLTFPKNRWVFVAATYDGSGDAAGVSLYQDGIQQVTTINKNNLAGMSTVGASPFAIGATDVTCWGGNITDAIIHNACLTPAQVRALYFDGIATAVQGRWGFTDNCGTTLTASAGGVNGTIFNAVWKEQAPPHFSTMKVNHPRANSLYFDRTSDWVSMGNTFNKEWNEAFSLSAWVWWDGDMGAGRVIISKLTPAGNAGYSFQVLYGSARLLFVLSNIWVTKAIKVYGPLGFPKKRWIHVLVTYSGSGVAAGVTLYQDGVQQVATINQDNLGGLSTVGATAFTIGALNASNGSVWGGWISDPRVHNAALTAAEVFKLYQNDVAAAEQAHWAFTEGSGTVVRASAGGVDGTITGADWSREAPQSFKCRAVMQQNLTRRSEDRTGWTATNVTLSDGAVFTLGNTTIAATLVDVGVANAAHYFVAPVFPVARNVIYTLSCYARAGTGQWLQLVTGASGWASNYRANFDLMNGVVGSVTNGTAWMKDLGGGLWRLNYRPIAPEANGSPAFTVAGITGTADAALLAFAGTNQTYYVGGLQVVQANWAGAYTKTTTGPVDTGSPGNIS